MLTKAARELATRHVEALAAGFGISVHYTRTFFTSESYLWRRRIFIAPIRTGSDYLGALHEIGHIVDRSSRAHEVHWRTAGSGKRGGYQEMMNESAAWAWAVQNAKPAILKQFSKADWRRIGDAWVSYPSAGALAY